MDDEITSRSFVTRSTVLFIRKNNFSRGEEKRKETRRSSRSDGESGDEIRWRNEEGGGGGRRVFADSPRKPTAKSGMNEEVTHNATFAGGQAQIPLSAPPPGIGNPLSPPALSPSPLARNPSTRNHSPRRMGKNGKEEGGEKGRTRVAWRRSRSV